MKTVQQIETIIKANISPLFSLFLYVSWRVILNMWTMYYIKQLLIACHILKGMAYIESSCLPLNITWMFPEVILWDTKMLLWFVYAGAALLVLFSRAPTVINCRKASAEYGRHVCGAQHVVSVLVRVEWILVESLLCLCVEYVTCHGQQR